VRETWRRTEEHRILMKIELEAHASPPTVRSEGQAWIGVDLGTLERRDRLVDVVNNSQRGRGRLRVLLRELVSSPPRKRERSGTLQPAIPITLLARLRALAKERKTPATSLIREFLSRYISFSRGRRLPRNEPKKGRRKYRTLRHAAELRQRGHELAGQPHRTQFSFDAGSPAAKAALESLIEEHKLNVSQFFCAAIERICRVPDRATPPAVVGEQSASAVLE
jgi:hypothetical protein